MAPGCVLPGAVTSLTGFLLETWSLLAGTLTILVALIAAGHAVIYKRDDRSAVGWVGLILLVPVIGSVLYVLLGINRIKRKASILRSQSPLNVTAELKAWREKGVESGVLPAATSQIGTLPVLMDRITRTPLTYQNAVQPLENGDEAYPEMLRCIDEAAGSVALSTYIFDHDRVGMRFVDCLHRAKDRGVEVRVLIDAVGARYSWPSMVRELKRRSIPVERFIPTVVPWRMPYMNLRNHRKILVVDGRTAFTGGMNIREGHLLSLNPSRPIRDLHFRVEGPVVEHMMEAFREDWEFATRERLDDAIWFPELRARGPVVARGVVDGPDEDIDKLVWTILGALSAAQKSVTIVTPYFLPDAALIQALNVAAIRGVAVKIVLPETNNQTLVKWASMARLWQLLERGCRVFMSRGPFDHTKLMLVDDLWALIGSANWDARSLRLNFEFNLECYDPDLAGQLARIAESKISESSELTIHDVNRRPLPEKLRDGVARLLSPYL